MIHYKQQNYLELKKEKMGQQQIHRHKRIETIIEANIK